ncbi:sulfite exporter TauE/SafE family protein [Sphingobacterium cavernae]|uniref:sulfite exporter TauE/SafE family protein n=1 Tax=Sphingobacterium cavernae TaxID=2592657 RepID=UPI00122FF5DA|nr:sulfite exporter TauE/SafE family protein [Sphingobacterium cavernae]
MSNKTQAIEILTVANKKKLLSPIVGFILLLKVVIISYFGYLITQAVHNNTVDFDTTFFLFIVAGFFAQLIDGALGMAYGVSCTTLLLSLGIPPKLASASVHTSEIFTTGVSGLSHIRFNNLDKKLFYKIVFTGVLGAGLGAYLLSDVLDGGVIKPYISAYLIFLGGYLIFKAVRKKGDAKPKTKYAPFLALFGGLFDAIGGGGWGPIVTSNLLSQGHNPRKTIGTVNTAEFFVTYFATIVFIFILGVQHLDIVLGLVIGGVIAAPIGAYVASKVNPKVLLILVGVLVVLTSGYSLFSFLK